MQPASRLRGSAGLAARDGSACIVNASRLTRTLTGPPRSPFICAAAGPATLLAQASTPAATGPASTARRGTGYPPGTLDSAFSSFIVPVSFGHFIARREAAVLAWHQASGRSLPRPRAAYGEVTSIVLPASPASRAWPNSRQICGLRGPRPHSVRRRPLWGPDGHHLQVRVGGDLGLAEPIGQELLLAEQLGLIREVRRCGVGRLGVGEDRGSHGARGAWLPGHHLDERRAEGG